MNILYCGDEGIRRGLLVSILSLLKHNTGQLSIYIMTIKITTEEAKERGMRESAAVVPLAKETVSFLDKLVKEKNSASFVKLIEATEIFLENLPKKNMGSYFTPCSMLRLYMDKVPELRRLERVLYLDYDVVCRGKLDEFYDTDLKGVEVAGVLDIYGRRFYKYHGLFKRKNDPTLLDARDEKEPSFFKQDYMNSGVMLFNMKECLKTGMFEKTRELCARRWMMLADQAALNKVISRRKLMPRKFNEQEERPRKETILHHFSNNFKFWPYFRVQKVKPFEITKIHRVLKIREYDDILERYKALKDNL